MKTINTILVVDDSAGDQFLSQAEIEDWDEGVKLLSAYDGNEALALLQQADSPPDLVLLDINMPSMNGLEFLAEYEKNNQVSLPPVVVMLTSSDQDRDKEQAGIYKCVKEYMVKPLTQEKINALAAAYPQWIKTE
ncbi:response regulator receiver protein [gamma proteobacterium IMCC1989]|nr:response regulator receiver protein [gamma proteobacterium IMCC1989]